MGERVNKFIAEEYTNMIGQVLKPGDKVVAVTTGYGHSVDVFTGIFRGVFRDWRGKIAGTKVSDIPYNSTVIEFCSDGEFEETKWVEGEKDRWGYLSGKSVPTGRRYNLIPLVKKYRSTMLQRNRVFKIDTSLVDVNI